MQHTCGCYVQPEHQLQQQAREAVARPGWGALRLRGLPWQDLQQLLQALVKGGNQSSRNRHQRCGAAAADAAAVRVRVAAMLCRRRRSERIDASGAAPEQRPAGRMRFILQVIIDDLYP